MGQWYFIHARGRQQHVQTRRGGGGFKLEVQRLQCYSEELFKGGGFAVWQILKYFAGARV